MPAIEAAGCGIAVEPLNSTPQLTFGARSARLETCQIRTFAADEVVMAKSVVGYALSVSSSAFASLRSGVSKPSVNQP